MNYMFTKSRTKQSPSQKMDTAFLGLCLICGLLVFVLMGGILVSLTAESLPALKRFGITFLYSQKWDPVAQEFGAASSIFGTIMSTLIALVLATPLSFVIALFLVELAPPFLSRIVGHAITMLAAIPSIIYGMWGLFVFAPFIANHVQIPLSGKLGFLPLFQGPPMGVGMLCAGIILALMILPFISAVMRDVFMMVPSVLKEAGHGMGSTTWEVTRHITIGYGLRGLWGAMFLGLGRAIGETMAVTFVIGNSHFISPSLFEAGNSIASTLANEFTEASEPLYLSALIELGLVLFAITFLIQFVSQIWIKKIQIRIGGGL